MNSNVTGRVARTLQAAFGPHTSNWIAETTPKQIDAWKAWRKEHAKPDTAESYAADQMAEHNTRRLPGER